MQLLAPLQRPCQAARSSTTPHHRYGLLSCFRPNLQKSCAFTVTGSAATLHIQPKGRTAVLSGVLHVSSLHDTLQHPSDVGSDMQRLLGMS
jgi:hypothetical protein